MAKLPKFDVAGFKDYIRRMNEAWTYMQKVGNTAEGIQGVMRKRGYADSEVEQRLTQEGIVYLAEGLMNTQVMKSFGEDLGLTVKSKNGDDFFLLSGRYVIPIRDMAGNIVAMVGWNNDSKKYITTSSAYFSKNTMFFGLENIPYIGHKEASGIFIVEGIFDRLAVEAAGGIAFATMGINSDAKKRILFSLMGRVVGIPDTDSEGLKVIKNDGWALPSNSSYFRWRGKVDLGDGKPRSIKDIDEFLKIMDPSTTREILSDVYQTTNLRTVTLNI